MKDGKVQVDVARVEELLRTKLLDPEELYRKIDLDHRTTRKVLEGTPVKASSVRLVLDALGVTQYESFLVPNPRTASLTRSQQLGVWEHDGPSSAPVETSNGLTFQVYKLRHQHVRGRIGRGKRYEWTDDDDIFSSRVRECLLRHANASQAVGHHPQIPVCLDTFPDPAERAWWVVDEWVDGQILQDRLAESPLPTAVLIGVMEQIAEGLDALHTAGVIRRELSPRFILLRPDDRVVLTEFELAKLLDQSPTVSRDWPDDPYRAPEVAGGNVSPAADVFSWGRLFVVAAIGKLTERRRVRGALENVEVPAPVRELVFECLHPLPSKRPQSARELLRVLNASR